MISFTPSPSVSATNGPRASAPSTEPPRLTERAMSRHADDSVLVLVAAVSPFDIRWYCTRFLRWLDGMALFRKTYVVFVLSLISPNDIGNDSISRTLTQIAFARSVSLLASVSTYDDGVSFLACSMT